MRLAVVRHEVADRDLMDAFVFIGRRSPESARRFRRAAERTFAQLAAHPGIGAPHITDNPRLADLRVSPVTRFRSYLVFYRATDDRLEVLRVLHAARDVDQVLADTLGPPDEPDTDGPEE